MAWPYQLTHEQYSWELEVEYTGYDTLLIISILKFEGGQWETNIQQYVTNRRIGHARYSEGSVYTGVHSTFNGAAQGINRWLASQVIDFRVKEQEDQ